MYKIYMIIQDLTDPFQKLEEPWKFSPKTSYSSFEESIKAIKNYKEDHRLLSAGITDETNRTIWKEYFI